MPWEISLYIRNHNSQQPFIITYPELVQTLILAPALIRACSSIFIASLNPSRLRASAGPFLRDFLGGVPPLGPFLWGALEGGAALGGMMPARVEAAGVAGMVMLVACKVVKCR